jgi:alkylated DNA repair dioxygenase AlkB
MLQGILPHIDLLKFDERVLGISLAAEATMIFRQSLTMVIRV